MLALESSIVHNGAKHTIVAMSQKLNQSLNTQIYINFLSLLNKFYIKDFSFKLPSKKLLAFTIGQIEKNTLYILLVSFPYNIHDIVNKIAHSFEQVGNLV